MSKPCGQCGKVDRYSNGNCRPCLRARMKEYYQCGGGKEVNRKYNQSDKGKAAKQKASRAHYRSNYVKHWLRRLKRRALEQGLPFDLSEYCLHVPDVCPILKVPLYKGIGKSGPCSPSADRVVPELGYVKGNVRVISQLANAMKQNATPEQLLAFASGIVGYLGLDGVSEGRC